ncbi:MAG: tRNA preQ1(34) S-adenosylmethionine ribosyltransferase-isomerase QueA [Candidatus Aminicenantes bacterium]|nr:tRNA preQ1(34) S-adenosylmethionine ribosyltransferase-isomerase QueA [Candidatus Aminicenantes bacterium]
MLTADFDYKLPFELIAQKPLLKREQSRMMVLHRKKGEIFHSLFKEFPDYLNKGDVLVLNNTKVLPARAWGKTEKREIEFLFLKEYKKGLWEILCRPAKKVKSGDIISFSPELKGEIVKVEPEGRRKIQFSTEDILSNLKKIGFAPLPPYIKRKKKNSELRALDLERYQTVFAQRQGAIAAPTAGLHFTPQILEKIRTKGVLITQISLDVGLATFQPVRAKRIKNHQMLEETFSISPAVSQIINKAKKDTRPVTAVGTTSVRALESAFRNGEIHSGESSTKLFIYPGYEFKVADRLLTNFHLPRSTLLMMVAAYAGLDLIKKAYHEAIHKKYRFYSYGDCMLIL